MATGRDTGRSDSVDNCADLRHPQLDSFGNPTKHPVTVNRKDSWSMRLECNIMFSQQSTTKSCDTKHWHGCTMATVGSSGNGELGKASKDSNISSQLSFWQSIDRTRAKPSLATRRQVSASDNWLDNNANGDELGLHNRRRSVVANWIYVHVTCTSPFGIWKHSMTSWKRSMRKMPPSSEVCAYGQTSGRQLFDAQWWLVAKDSLLVVKGHAPITQSIDPVSSDIHSWPVDSPVLRLAITSWNNTYRHKQSLNFYILHLGCQINRKTNVLMCQEIRNSTTDPGRLQVRVRYCNDIPAALCWVCDSSPLITRSYW